MTFSHQFYFRSLRRYDLERKHMFFAPKSKAKYLSIEIVNSPFVKNKTHLAPLNKQSYGRKRNFVNSRRGRNCLFMYTRLNICRNIKLRNIIKPSKLVYLFIFV